MKAPAKAKSESPATALPTEKDFDPWNGCLDAQHAWKQFGGLDLEQAHEKLCENPLNYQEDFMFMGPKAFKFYFPVVDRFLRREREPWEFDDSQAWILGKAMRLQLERRNDDELLKSIGDLCQHVRTHLSKYATDENEQAEIGAAWLEVESQLAKKPSK
ncbi:MAG: hypothetical protein HZA92_11605 [Verrucomicrobia bacterium]|nr:hypothetical protein [Verrucomicrobiota bacterium]